MCVCVCLGRNKHKPVLDLQQVAYQAVGGWTFHEIALCRHELLGVWTAELLVEILEQRALRILFNLRVVNTWLAAAGATAVADDWTSLMGLVWMADLSVWATILS